MSRAAYASQLGQSLYGLHVCTLTRIHKRAVCHDELYDRTAIFLHWFCRVKYITILIVESHYWDSNCSQQTHSCACPFIDSQVWIASNRFLKMLHSKQHFHTFYFWFLGETLFLDVPTIKQMLDFCRKVFPTVGYAYNIIPSYPTGHLGYVIASRAKVCCIHFP